MQIYTHESTAETERGREAEYVNRDTCRQAAESDIYRKIGDMFRQTTQYSMFFSPYCQ